MKNCSLTLATLVLALVFSVATNAQNIKRTYKNTNGETVTVVRQGDRDILQNGNIRKLTRWGNQISQDTPKGLLQFTPHNGQLPEADFQVGLKWTHTYDISGGGNPSTSRTRNCEVKQQAPFAIGSFTYDAAWQIVCHSKLASRPLGKDEVTWYTKDRIIISYHESWGGSSPGSYGSELVGPPLVTEN